ncbi:T5orf172 domain-containing protein [Moumouvirus australiensis]|uniref:T5orf172 domain-containing protein n=1 Tax=Moumouvirus australiensis TaxID=2109587 RepID=A0A2P1EKI0_9VIRU|nr:T5orf172 domain-containing protein [Moumouvirus australiensis]YP_010789334.1 T5orf172 domain-containing protein [Moumouvirus australiensis]AVL94393.1 T5orf172 domain-containing protein [Moumouvirus australiensis]AVL94400.1 T5orf172 domain-containing protein [Moumouvirus australiensis]
MKYIYIISTTEQSNNNIYKIGRHKGSKSKLIKRYRTYLINPIVFYFEQVHDYVVIENIIKKFLSNFIIKDKKGKDTEWVNLKISKLISVIKNAIDIYNKTNNFENNNDDDDDENILCDPLDLFIKNCLVKSSKKIIKSSDLYKAFNEYDKNKTYYNTVLFKQMLEKKGYKSVKNSCIVYKGIGFVNNIRDVIENFDDLDIIESSIC